MSSCFIASNPTHRNGKFASDFWQGQTQLVFPQRTVHFFGHALEMVFTRDIIFLDGDTRFAWG